MSIEIIEFNKDDIEIKNKISSLMTESLIDEYGNPPNDSYIKDLLDYYHSREDSKIFFLLENSEIAGFTWLIESEDVITANKFICVLYLYITEPFRGKGYSKILMKKNVEYSKSIGINQLRLSVRKNNPNAINLYDSLGYKTYKYEMCLDI
ncbi:MAG: GNAT family N-acetyltransferase [Candidatus Sericytochromatia bacterium]